MYNRYIRNDQGGYSRIPVEDGPLPQSQSQSQPQSHAPPPPPRQEAHPPPPDGNGMPHGAGMPHGGGHTAPPPHPNGEDSRTGGISGFLRRILDKFHLDNVDTGDLLLLAILFFLFKEDADDELLIALGLLLIL